MSMEFAPIAGLIGGMLIGLASAGLWLFESRIAGISGILGGSFLASAGDRAWRVAFLLGLPLGAFAMSRLGLADPGFTITHDPLLLGCAGLLVGVGTQLGNGCTSGHGVCGLGRGSARSLAATLTFMATAALTVFVARHVLGSAG